MVNMNNRGGEQFKMRLHRGQQADGTSEQEDNRRIIDQVGRGRRRQNNNTHNTKRQNNNNNFHDRLLGKNTSDKRTMEY